MIQKKYCLPGLFLFFAMGCEQESKTTTPRYIMAIHGGAGTILKANMTPELEKAYTAKLKEAAKAGYEAIQSGKPGMEAIVNAIEILEDSPLFNAGKGAVFTHNGKNELDAALMDGKTQNAGAVAGVSNIKNPIKLARAVMEKSIHVILSGRGAEQFAIQTGQDTVPASYFFTERRWESLQKALKNSSDQNALLSRIPHDHVFGTVGAVALDKAGNLSAGTSTGGMTNKKFGRIGDTPIIGCGTYANGSAAVSCTGWGEYFIRATAASRVALLMEYTNMEVEKAATSVIRYIEQLGGNGGMIALDKAGNVAMPFNTAGMYRATVTEDGTISVSIYKD